MNLAPPSPKGFRDIDPGLAQKRRQTINKIVEVLEEFGFVPIETPTIEFAQTLTGKYGEEEKLIYKFTDRGGRELALRYDLTVPLARFIASNQELIAKGPFRRYQIGQVFRGENPQHGRYREFTQFDFDSVGLDNTDDSTHKEDAKIITAAINSVRKVGLKNAIMAINHRGHFSEWPIEAIRAFDKLHKIGMEGVEKELLSKGLDQTTIESFKFQITEGKRHAALDILFKYLNDNGLVEGKDYFFDPTLARGLDYYTSTIYELKTNKNAASLSIGAGGRYDNLIGMFAKKPIPAVGFSFGIDRTIEALE